MDWSNELILQFLELYKAHPLIWNPNYPNHKNRPKVSQAWDQICQHMQNEYNASCTVYDLKKKRESLMASYRDHKRKIKRAEISGGHIYEPSWFAYPLMDSFLAPVYTYKEFSTITEGEEYQYDQKLEPDSEAEASSDLEQYIVVNPSTSQTTPKPLKRKQPDPLDIKNERKQPRTEETYEAFDTVTMRQSEDDDECDLFGKLIAKKFRRLPDDRRDLLMIKIIELFYTDSQC